jgi:hypothetical protein
MDDFETLYDTRSSGHAHTRKQSRKVGVVANATRVSVAGRIGNRTKNNKHYSSTFVEKDVYKLEDPKYRSLKQKQSYYTSVGCGRAGTYNEEFEYKPGVPHTATVKSEVDPHAYTGDMEDTMMLLDAEHALNAEKVNKLSHGGIRSIPRATHTDPVVSDVVPLVGPDAMSLNRMRGLSYQFNYTDPSGLVLMAKENFMSAMAGKITNPNSTARPATTIVGN